MKSPLKWTKLFSIPFLMHCMKVFKFLAHSEKEMLLRIIEETDMRSERQISDVFSNKYKFIDEENVGIILNVGQ